MRLKRGSHVYHCQCCCFVPVTTLFHNFTDELDLQIVQRQSG